MSKTTRIEWATSSWNPFIGCTKVSPGCLNCYAENSTPTRVARSYGTELWGKGQPRQRTSESYWQQPLKWNRDAGVMAAEAAAKQFTHERPRVFPSLCDWLDDEVPLEWLVDFLKLIHDTPNLDWLLLTKRPENFAALFDTMRRLTWPANREWIDRWYSGEPPGNVWLGVSVEDQTRAVERIPELLDIPTAVRFLSVEPLLGPVDLTPWIGHNQECTKNWAMIAWIILGGESGHGARPCRVEWIRDLVRQTKVAGVSCYVKQMGSNSWADSDEGLHCSASDLGTDDVDWRAHWEHPKGGDPAEWPNDLRVRQFPNESSSPATPGSAAPSAK